MVKSIPFKREHLDVIVLNEAYEDRQVVIGNYDDLRGYFIETVVEVESKDVLAVLTGMEIFSGNMEVTALVSPFARKYPVQFFRHVRARIGFFEAKLRLRRVQSTIREGHNFLIKWMELLGFKIEGHMEKFGPLGDDYMLYAKVKK